MGIKSKKSATYVADTGREHELEEMSDSHILNVIVHHQRQLEAVRVINKSMVTPPHHLNAWEQSLNMTICELARELGTRDPDTSHERTGKEVWKKGNLNNDY